MIDQPIRSDARTPASAAQTAVLHIVRQSSTTPAERFLLLAAVSTLPLEKHIPTVAGMSFSFLIFAVLAAYVLVNRSRFLGKLWYHPVFIVAYAFVGISALLEFSSPLSRYDEIIRFAQMIGGAVFVAVLCRDRSGLVFGLYGYIGAAVWVSTILYMTSYGMLTETGATSSFQEANNLRGRLDTGITANKNLLAVVCSQGVIVTVALSLSDRLKRFRILLGTIGIFCLVASFLPMSRSGALFGFVSVATILYAHGVKYGKALIFASIFGMAIYMLVPDVVWSRMTFSAEVGASGRQEARAYIYTTALNHLSEYVISGVGAGNYYGSWATKNGFYSSRGVLGAHNTLLQITIFWGVLALFMYMWFIWLIYRLIPLRCGRDELSLALLGIIVSYGMILLASHGFYDKLFSFGIGMLVGARQWIWPTGTVTAAEVSRCETEDDNNISKMY